MVLLWLLSVICCAWIQRNAVLNLFWQSCKVEKQIVCQLYNIHLSSDKTLLCFWWSPNSTCPTVLCLSLFTLWILCMCRSWFSQYCYCWFPPWNITKLILMLLLPPINSLMVYLLQHYQCDIAITHIMFCSL